MEDVKVIGRWLVRVGFNWCVVFIRWILIVDYIKIIEDVILIFLLIECKMEKL